MIKGSLISDVKYSTKLNQIDDKLSTTLYGIWWGEWWWGVNPWPAKSGVENKPPRIFKHVIQFLSFHSYSI
jgi:hypothetical protein